MPAEPAAKVPSDTASPLVGLPGWTIATGNSTGPGKSTNWRPSRRDGLWLSPSVFDFLAQNPQGFTTEVIRCYRESDNTTVLLTKQVFTFSAPGNVSESAGGQRSRYDLRRRALSPFTFRVLTIGQLLTSGPYAFDGLNGLPAHERATLLSSVGQTLSRAEPGYRAVLLKDACLTGSETATNLSKLGFYSLPVDPVMELTLRPEWNTLDDYVENLTSKYRVRYRRARGKMAGLTRRLLSPSEVRSYSSRLYELYLATSTGAAYNAATLTPNYFTRLAASGDHQVTGSGGGGKYATYVTGYFDGATLIGFTTALRNGPVLHAHYLGLVAVYKGSHHLYHNVLFDLLETAIRCGVKTLDYGRTALEIKSSIGAEGVEYACLVKASNPVLNRLIPLFTPAVYTAAEWTPRSPFNTQESP